MNVFQPNSTVSITVPFVDINGSPVVPVGLSYVVLDGDDEELVGATDVFGSYTPGMVEIAVIIPPEAHVMVGPRVLVFTITDADGNEIVSEEVYGINSVRRLVVLENSFQTYTSAAFLALDIPNLEGWTGASKSEQEAAMIEAYSKIKRLNFVVPDGGSIDIQSRLEPTFAYELAPRMWSLMTEDIFYSYPDVFLTALKKAQIAEADQILTGDPIADKIRSGLFSEKVGESSMMFKTGVAPLNLGVSRRAFDYLTGYINHRMVIART